MSDTQDGKTAPEASEPVVDQHQLSRRKVLRAGLVAVPVLMSLPAVPAWAGGTNYTLNSGAYCKNNRTNAAITNHPGTSSCVNAQNYRMAHSKWYKYKVSGGTADISTEGAAGISESPLGGSPFDAANSPFSKSPFDKP